jgi:peptidoglycan hydrolase-like protein with peptidoglycan-binding domain
MFGKIPMYRTLRNGVDDGTDIKQLETGLHALGFDPDGMTIDSTFTSATTAAVKAWQKDIGVTQDGIVTPGLVQFLPSKLRIQSMSAQIGDSVASASPLYAASGTGRVATVTLSAADSTVAKTGEQVSVSLPNGESVSGVITSIATSSSSSSTGGGAGSGGGAVNQQGASSTTSSASVNVTVSITDAKADAQPDQTPVSIAFTSNGAKGVLAAPVTALIALAGGGYALEVQDSGGATHLVATKPGLYAVGGLVEVSGSGITDGTTVVIPAGA